ncbi:MAG: Smr/MutS family protein [Bacteroidia bacterium]
MRNKDSNYSKVTNYPNSIQQKLGFDKVIEFIQSACSTIEAKNQIESIPFLRNFKHIHSSIRQVIELSMLHESGAYFEFPENLSLVLEEIGRTHKSGAILLEDELFLIQNAMLCFETNFQIVNSNKDLLIETMDLVGGLNSLQVPIQLLNRTLDDEGNIKINASPKLFELHKKISLKEKDLRKLLQSKFDTAKKNGWAGDTEITIRNERLVLPIIAEHKKKIPGFVHDDSQSGKFLYIEPIECFEENNQLKELFLEKKKEIENILRQTTSELSNFADEIGKHVQSNIQLDVLSAKAKFSRKIGASEPQFVEKHDSSELINAYHPLLLLLLNSNNKKTVPLNFYFQKDNYLVLISGPNAGGKSIALKTIGLLQYMYQSGLPIPASPDSKFSIYNSIFIDIGDNQSIENNLSSYSSHLMSMKYFLEHSNGHTLYLIDELGNGTDPAIGSTIAQAILELMLSKKSIGVVTTHFGNLKAWASNTIGVQNARMLYDLKHLEPLFILEPDKPGSSFALEVASKVGIDPSILKRAKQISKWKQQIDLDELLAENEKQKKELESSKARIDEREKVLQHLIQEYENLKESVQSNKQHIINEAKIKANEILNQTNQKIEQTIKEIKENKAEKVKTKTSRQNLNTFKDELQITNKPVIVQNKKFNKPKNISDFKVGSIVKHYTHKSNGEILQIKKGQAQIVFGDIKMWLPLNDLEIALSVEKQKAKTATFNVDQFNKQSNFKPEIDLRGIRGEDAIETIDNWLLDAKHLGMYTLRIIHGRGFGILRKLIQQKLKSTGIRQISNMNRNSWEEMELLWLS